MHQVLYGRLPRARGVSTAVTWGDRPAGLTAPPSTGVAATRRTKRPAPKQLLPHIESLYPEFVRSPTTRVTRWDLGFDRVTAFATQDDLFPLERAAVHRDIELPPLAAPPPPPIHERLPSMPEPRPREPGQPVPFSGRWRLSLAERRVVVVGWLRSLGRCNDSRPTHAEYVIVGALVGVKWTTARDYWQRRDVPHDIVGRPRLLAPEEAAAGLPELLRTISEANEYVYASFFTSEAVALALIQRAKDGLQVLVYIDGNQAASGGNSDSAILAMLLAADIKVKVLPSSSMMHEKFMLFDGTMLFVGSSNASVNGMGSIEQPTPSNQEANVLLGADRSTITDSFRRKFIKEFKVARDVESVFGKRAKRARMSS